MKLTTDNVNEVSVKWNGKKWLPVIIIDVLFLLLGLVSIIPVMFSVMIYDSPDAGGVFTNMLFISVIGFPLLVLISIILSLILCGLKKWKAARYVSLLPILDIILFAIALFGISYFQDGSFVPK
jgi:hypothetical protein